MASTGTQHNKDASVAPMVGDHLAMDLLNTQASMNGDTVDFWPSADAVIAWLERCGIVPAAQHKGLDKAALLAQAVALRKLARGLIAKRKEDTAVDAAALNDYLHAYVSAPHLDTDNEGRLVLTRSVRSDAIASLLGPVAEAVAQLLVDGDSALIKQCEHPDCILWFYDRTKSHKRRWCSMALCGNRYKAAQFRKKSASEV